MDVPAQTDTEDRVKERLGRGGGGQRREKHDRQRPCGGGSATDERVTTTVAQHDGRRPEIRIRCDQHWKRCLPGGYYFDPGTLETSIFGGLYLRST